MEVTAEDEVAAPLVVGLRDYNCNCRVRGVGSNVIAPVPRVERGCVLGLTVEVEHQVALSTMPGGGNTYSSFVLGS